MCCLWSIFERKSLFQMRFFVLTIFTRITRNIFVLLMSKKTWVYWKQFWNEIRGRDYIIIIAFVTDLLKGKQLILIMFIQSNIVQQKNNLDFQQLYLKIVNKNLQFSLKFLKKDIEKEKVNNQSQFDNITGNEKCSCSDNWKWKWI